MTPRRLLLVLVVLLAPPRNAAAQPAVPVSLADAAVWAVARVPEVVVQRDGVQASEVAEDRAQAAFDPVVRLDGRVRSRTDPLNTLFLGAPDGALAPRVTSVGGSASWSKLFDTGATVTGTTSVTTERTNGLFALLTPAFLTSVGVEVRQPLLQGRRIDAARQRVRVTSIDSTRSRARLARTLLEVVASVEQAYWTLAAAREEVAVRERVLTLAEAQRREWTVRIDAGIAPESDLASADAAIAARRTDVIAAVDRATRAELALKQWLVGDLEDPLWDSRLVLVDRPPPLPSSMEASALVTDALTRRPEAAELDADADRAALDQAQAADVLRPRVDVVAGYALRGLAGTENPDMFVPFPGGIATLPDDLRGHWGQAARNALGHRFVDASLGLSVTLPLGNRAARADAASAAIAASQVSTARRAFERRVAHDVRVALSRLTAATARRAAAAEARDAAIRQLQAERDRDAAGVSSAFLLLTRQTELAQAESADVTARADEAQARTELERVTGRLLERHGIDAHTGSGGTR